MAAEMGYKEEQRVGSGHPPKLGTSLTQPCKVILSFDGCSLADEGSYAQLKSTNILSTI